MAEVYFRKNGTTYHLRWVNELLFPFQERLMFKSASGTESVPAMSTQGTAVYSGGKHPSSKVKIYYDTSSPTIAFRKNGTTYYCSKETKYAGRTSGSIVSTSVSSFHLSTHWYEKDITVNFKLSKTSSGYGIPSPKYRLKYSVRTSGSIVITSVLSIILSSNWREKDITVNFKLTRSSSGTVADSPKYRLK